DVALIEGGRVTIEVADDGRGFDLGALREAVVRARVLTAEQAAAASDGEIGRLAFHAGISTTPVVTTISGQGVGVAIVREWVERLEGRVTQTAAAGRGTVARTELPTTVATSRGLLIQAGSGRSLLPQSAVESAIGASPEEISAAAARRLMTFA